MVYYTMDTVLQRYANFQRFLAEVAPPGSFWLTIMASVPLETFLHGIAAWLAAEPRLTLDQITDKVLAHVGLTRREFTPAQLDTFLLCRCGQ